MVRELLPDINGLHDFVVVALGYFQILSALCLAVSLESGTCRHSKNICGVSEWMKESLTLSNSANQPVLIECLLEMALCTPGYNSEPALSLFSWNLHSNGEINSKENRQRTSVRCCGVVGWVPTQDTAILRECWFKSKLFHFRCRSLMMSWESSRRLAQGLGLLPPTYLGDLGEVPGSCPVLPLSLSFLLSLLSSSL